MKGTEMEITMEVMKVLGLLLENEIQKMESNLWNLTVKNNDLAAYTQRFQELTMLCTKIVPEDEDRVKRFIDGLPDNIQGMDCRSIISTTFTQRGKVVNQRALTCFECGRQGHFRSDSPKLKGQNRGNKTRNKSGTGGARGKSYVLAGGYANPDSHVVTGMFLLNNHYAYVLFDSGANQSFVSTTFSTLLDIIPNTLDVSYAIELADGRISKTNTVLRGCTLGLLIHPFNIDLMPVEIDSFDVIIDMDWVGYVVDVKERASHQLKIHEKNYTTHDLELEAVVFTLKRSEGVEHETK
nr:reverse transcriptase domain-containing protein [Tanacetum cinerariifolium]